MWAERISSLSYPTFRLPGSRLALVAAAVWAAATLRAVSVIQRAAVGQAGAAVMPNGPTITCTAQAQGGVAIFTKESVDK